jgi:isopenicillin N synthase-like dioxygenase
MSIVDKFVGLPKGTIQGKHRFERSSGDNMRWIRAKPPKGGSKFMLGGHSDAGSVTVLFNELGGLQCQIPDGTEDPAMQYKASSIMVEDVGNWAYVRPLPGHAIINLGMSLVKFTAGGVRGAVHRVIEPPGAQAGSTRYSLAYFSRPELDIIQRPFVQSEVIRNRVPEAEYNVLKNFHTARERLDMLFSPIGPGEKRSAAGIKSFAIGFS